MLLQDMCHSRTPTRGHGLCRLCAQNWKQTGSGLRWYRCLRESVEFLRITSRHIHHRLKPFIISSRSLQLPLRLPKPSVFVSHDPTDWLVLCVLEYFTKCVINGHNWMYLISFGDYFKMCKVRIGSEKVAALNCSILCFVHIPSESRIQAGSPIQAGIDLKCFNWSRVSSTSCFSNIGWVSITSRVCAWWQLHGTTWTIHSWLRHGSAWKMATNGTGSWHLAYTHV